MSDGLKLLSLVIEHESTHVLRDLEADLFVDEEAEVYRFIRSHFRRYGNIPAFDTVENDTGVEIPEATESFDYYLKKVQDRKLYTLLRGDYERLKTSLRTFDMDQAREVVHSMRAATRTANDDRVLLTTHEAGQIVLSDYDNAHRNPGITGIPSGWPSFDEKTSGYQPGDLVSWVARPEMGKTYTLLKQAHFAYRSGASVLIVTTEMTISQVMRRFVGIDSRIDPRLIRSGQLSTHAQRRLTSLIDSYAGCRRLHVYSGGKHRRVSDVDMLIQEIRPDIVYIDGIYLMLSDNKKPQNRAERVTEVFDEAKEVTNHRNLPIICTSQFNRVSGKKGRDGSLETVAYSDAISTHSSLVISLQEGSPGRERDARRSEFIKGREGEGGIVEFWYKFRPVNFEEVPPDEGGVGSDDEDEEALDWTM